jgi:hypothetical protein
MRQALTAFLLLAAGFSFSARLAAQELSVPNAGFEAASSTETTMASGWNPMLGKGTDATIALDSTVAHSGRQSIRFIDKSPFQAFIFAMIASDPIQVKPETTYELGCYIKGSNAGRFFIGADFGGALGEQRQAVPDQVPDWQHIKISFTTPAECHEVKIQLVADGLVPGMWVDDVSLAVAAHQQVNLTEPQYPRSYTSWFPRTPGKVPEHLIVADNTRETTASRMMLAALQGIVNRKAPRLYLINTTNPRYYDEVWLRYMQEKGYTGEPIRIKDPQAVLKHFRDDVSGVIVYDPAIPGTMNAAWMLAGIKNAIPTSPEGVKQWNLPIVEDLRGRFKRNVDAYRYVYDNYWDQMSHHLLAWQHPKDPAVSCRDYEVQWNVFTFWISAYGDHEPGADPLAETDFVNEVLANTPGNVPVMGWMKWTDNYGIDEYAAARLLSEYGKWLPGTGFNSNVSVISAIHPAEGTFKQKFRQQPGNVKLQQDKLYLSIDVLDSGDAHWYFQTYQRGIWADPLRGTMPIAYCMNMTIYDTLPLVAQWYYENMTPNESFFGLLYMNAPVYASRFRKADRERIWHEYIAYNDEYCRKMDMDGLEIYTGGSGGPSGSDELLRRFTKGMKNLNYILAGLGRHRDVTPENANYMLDNTVIFRTQNDFHIWTATDDLGKRSMDSENDWMISSLTSAAPARRPAFLSTMAVSWTYYPLWIMDLHYKLPQDYVPVSPNDLARLYRESLKK